MEKQNITTALNKLTDDIDKRFGKGSLINLEEKITGIEFISTGVFSLDLAVGGGYPKGRIIEIYGPESSGKTTIAIHAIIEAQKQDGVVGFIDAEHAFDLSYAMNLGLNKSKDKFRMSQPDNGEQALEICEAMVRSGVFSMIIIDSVAALTPKAEIEGEMGDSKMGLQARLMSQALRKLVAIISKTNTIVIFINQLRDKMVMFGNPETTTGGNALKFYASLRLDVRKTGQEKDGDEVTANKTRVKVVKNKVAPPFKKAEFNICFGTGVDVLQDIIDIASELEIIKKSGSWYSYGDTKLGQGSDKVKVILNNNPELLEEIKEKVLIKISEL